MADMGDDVAAGGKTFLRELQEVADRLSCESDGSARAKVARDWYEKVLEERGRKEADQARIFFEVALAWSTSEAQLKSELKKARDEADGGKGAIRKEVLYPVLVIVIVAALGYFWKAGANFFRGTTELVVTKIETTEAGPSVFASRSSAGLSEYYLDVRGGDSVLRSWEAKSFDLIYKDLPVKIPHDVDSVEFVLRALDRAAAAEYIYKEMEPVPVKESTGKCVLYRVQMGGGGDVRVISSSDIITIFFSMREAEE